MQFQFSVYLHRDKRRERERERERERNVEKGRDAYAIKFLLRNGIEKITLVIMIPPKLYFGQTKRNYERRFLKERANI